MTTSRHPVDQGYAWVICLAAGVQAYFVVGGLKSMGVLFVSLVDLFDASPSVTSLTLGLVAAGFAIFALLSTAASEIFGHKYVSLFGAVLCFFSAFVSMWAMNIIFVIVFLGALSGLAFGAMATPAIVLLNYYFDKRKSLANGLAMVGSSIGQLSLPYLLTYFIDEYGFRGAMLLYSGICLHSIPASLLLRPTSFWGPASKPAADRDPTGNERSPTPTPTPHNLTSVSAISNNSVHSSHPSLSSFKGSKLSLKPIKHSTLHESTGSIMLGLSVENLAADPSDRDTTRPPTARRPNFCQVLFDRDLVCSVTMWLLFCAVGIGHAGFIDACLYLPALAYDLFLDKYKGAFLIFIIGAFDIIGRIGGGWFADLGLINRTHLTGIAMTITGGATVLCMFYPVFGMLVFYSIVMGVVGGTYRILLPVLVKDLFGPSKISSGVGLGYLSMGVFILPVPYVLGKMKEVYGSYVPAMMLCGALLLAGGCLMFAIPAVKRHEDGRSGAYEVAMTTDVHPEVSIVIDAVADDNAADQKLDDAEMTEEDIADVKM